VPGNVAKIMVGREHCQVMSEAKLRQQSVDCANLNSTAPTPIFQRGGVDVIVSSRRQQRQGGKALNYLGAVPWPRKSLQKFLKHKAGGQNRLACNERPPQCLCLWDRSRHVAPEGQRPHAGIDKQAQSRLRSAL
jgi:hypothetical protein